MAKIVGLFKELSEDEQLLYEPKDSVLAMLVKELEVKKLMGVERKEYSLVYAIVYPYLTNRRLLLLALHQSESKFLVDHKAPKIPLRSGVWLEVPIKAVSLAELRSVDVKKDHDLSRFVDWAGLKEDFFDRAPAVEVVYDDRQAAGKMKDYVDMVLEMGIVVKDQRKVERSFDKLLLIGEDVASDLLPLLKELLERPVEVREEVGEEGEEALA